jgi:hypothetical protein
LRRLDAHIRIDGVAPIVDEPGRADVVVRDLHPGAPALGLGLGCVSPRSVVVAVGEKLVDKNEDVDPFGGRRRPDHIARVH